MKIIIMSLLLMLNWSQSWAGNVTATRSNFILKVDDSELADEKIIELTESLGGYFFFRNNQRIGMKVPTEKSQQLVAFIKTQGNLIMQEYFAYDVIAEIENERARLKSKQSVIEQYIEVLNQANIDNLIYVETEIADLVSEIELSKGRIRLLRHRIDYADVQVDFNFRDRSEPEQKKPSSFAWLNTISLIDLLEDFEDESR